MQPNADHNEPICRAAADHQGEAGADLAATAATSSSTTTTTFAATFANNTAGFLGRDGDVLAEKYKLG